jgi:hypothetical protein
MVIRMRACDIPSATSLAAVLPFLWGWGAVPSPSFVSEWLAAAMWAIAIRLLLRDGRPGSRRWDGASTGLGLGIALLAMAALFTVTHFDSEAGLSSLTCLTIFSASACFIASIWLTHIKTFELRALMAGLQNLHAPLQPLLGGQRFQLD